MDVEYLDFDFDHKPYDNSNIAEEAAQLEKMENERLKKIKSLKKLLSLTKPYDSQSVKTPLNLKSITL